jgi:phage recombination protein Bet
MAEKALATIHTGDVDIFDDNRMRLIRQKFANDAPQEDFEIFIEFCRSRQLDPLQRQVYLIPRTSQGKKVWTIQTSIDGYRAIADRTGAYAGSDDAVLEYKNNVLLAATVTVWKMVQGVRCPFTATARWTEYKGNSPLWATMPATMLSKCAESLALRKAFPSQLSGLYTSEEMAQADRDSAPINGATITPFDATRGDGD